MDFKIVSFDTKKYILDVLLQISVAQGFFTLEIVSDIEKNNTWWLDIVERAQLQIRMKEEQ